MVKNQVSGLSSPGAYAFYTQDSSLPKMFQLCLDGEWDVFSQTFTRAGIMLGGTVSQLPPLVPLTKETGSSSSRGPNTEGMWPTPCADGDRATMFKQGGMPLGVAVRRWPTPTAEQAGEGKFLETLVTKEGSPAKPGERAYNPKTGMLVQVTLNRAVLMWPRTTAQDAKNKLNTASGKLNPTWVEWLMGFPLGHTDSDA